MFDELVVEGLVAGGALLDVPLDGVAGGLEDGVAGAPEDPAGVSFFSEAGAGAFSASDGGFSLFE